MARTVVRIWAIEMRIVLASDTERPGGGFHAATAVQITKRKTANVTGAQFATIRRSRFLAIPGLKVAPSAAQFKIDVVGIHRIQA